MYISWLNATVPTPRYQLVDFGNIFLNIGETKILNATITSDSMAVWIQGKGFVIQPGLLLTEFT